MSVGTTDLINIKRRFSTFPLPRNYTQIGRGRSKSKNTITSYAVRYSVKTCEISEYRTNIWPFRRMSVNWHMNFETVLKLWLALFQATRSKVNVGYKNYTAWHPRRQVLKLHKERKKESAYAYLTEKAHSKNESWRSYVLRSMWRDRKHVFRVITLNVAFEQPVHLPGYAKCVVKYSCGAYIQLLDKNWRIFH
jgi:hypothetical protein